MILCRNDYHNNYLSGPLSECNILIATFSQKNLKGMFTVGRLIAEMFAAAVHYIRIGFVR